MTNDVGRERPLPALPSVIHSNALLEVVHSEEVEVVGGLSRARPEWARGERKGGGPAFTGGTLTSDMVSWRSHLYAVLRQTRAQTSKPVSVENPNH